RELIAARLATRPRADWLTIFEGSDACVAPVLTWDEAAAHPHLSTRQVVLDAHGVRQPAPAPRFSATPAELTSPPPEPGEHTRAALIDWGVPDVDHLIETGGAIQR